MSKKSDFKGEFYIQDKEVRKLVNEYEHLLFFVKQRPVAAYRCEHRMRLLEEYFEGEEFKKDTKGLINGHEFVLAMKKAVVGCEFETKFYRG